MYVYGTDSSKDTSLTQRILANHASGVIVKEKYGMFCTLPGALDTTTHRLLRWVGFRYPCKVTSIDGGKRVQLDFEVDNVPELDAIFSSKHRFYSTSEIQSPGVGIPPHWGSKYLAILFAHGDASSMTLDYHGSNRGATVLVGM